MKIKRTAAAVLAAVIAFGSLAAVGVAEEIPITDNQAQTYAADDVIIEGVLKYKELEDGTLGVLGFSDGNEELAQVDIPTQVNGKQVTAIEQEAFRRCRTLTAVTIPDGITRIGTSAFVGCGITSVFIPASVEKIGFGAFSFCSELNALTISDGVQNIDDEAFRQCGKLTSVNIPSSVTEIGWLAFYECAELTSINIPGSVTEVGRHAFGKCSALTEINVDPANAEYSSADGVLFNKDKTKLIKFPEGKAVNQSYNVPESVTEIDDGAFTQCALSSVTVPASVTEIGKPYLSRECENNAFESCANLVEINVDTKNANYSSEGGVLFNKDKTQLIAFPAGKTDKSYTAPESVREIVGQAFLECGNLTSIMLPNRVERIGVAAFKNCENLELVTFPDCIATFKNLLALPDSVKFIGSLFITNSMKIAYVIIPDSVAFIGEFGTYSTGLRDVYYGGSKEDWSNATAYWWKNGGEDNYNRSDKKMHYNCEAADFTDSDTQINISGIFPKGSEFVVKADKELNGDTQCFKYDLSFIGADGKETQPESKVAVKIPMPEELMDKAISIDRVSDGKIEHVGNFYVNDMFYTNDLGTFIFSIPADITSSNTSDESSNNSAGKPDLPAPGGTDAANSDTTSGGDNKPTGIALAIYPAILAASVVVVIIKKKK